MATEYSRNYYKHYYKKYKTRYKLYRQAKYESLKPYYRQYYINNKITIKETSYQNKIKKSTPFERIVKPILVTFD
jgi:hypothetical protein